MTTPLTYKPCLPPERLMIIGGVGDRLAPPKHSRILWDHWGRCRIHWFPGNHVLHLDRRDLSHRRIVAPEYFRHLLRNERIQQQFRDDMAQEWRPVIVRVRHNAAKTA